MERKGVDRLEVWRTLMDAFKVIQKSADRNLEPLGMRLQELRLLFTLSNQGAVSMSVLAEEQFTTQASITGLVDGLEGRGLVERLRSTQDRRVINVGITKKGMGALDVGLRRHREHVDRLLGGLSDGEMERLASLMERLRRESSET